MVVNNAWNQFIARHWLEGKDGSTIMLPSFICSECSNQNHAGCPGGSHCDCQHGVSDRTRREAEK